MIPVELDFFVGNADNGKRVNTAVRVLRVKAHSELYRSRKLNAAARNLNYQIRVGNAVAFFRSHFHVLFIADAEPFHLLFQTGNNISGSLEILKRFAPCGGINNVPVFVF